MKRLIQIASMVLLGSIAVATVEDVASARSGNLAGRWFNQMASHWQAGKQQLSQVGQGDRLSCNLVSVSPKRQITRLCATQSHL
ncbi:hypothetical protein H6G51_12395 [Limnothrix sp. FACHB-708]|uniref:hypothetical protein n=1 Tax=unclassified Limnothrix TaxID=2632864 RepID=UPI001682BBBF|nr:MULTISPECIES: hypothetical protein [unclassified Limnothrix]MBD2554082.1 hypothetical protein [Limnothrix sp. FACHB-708]MBD2591798.1 hypothetical protein [Limnothrix sp. FACHB-406]